MNHLLRFDHADATRVELTGGKGASLGRLTLWGFPVPKGVVVTSSAYLAFLGDLRPVTRLLAGLAQDSPESLRVAALAIQEHLSRLPLPAGLEVMLTEALAAFPEGTAFSVRSSATMEDLASAAFAGQHETFLNCRGIPFILDRIKACWLSLWSHRAVSYRVRQGFDHQKAAMSVVVQEMVFCDVAGVGFGIDPVAGRLDRMVFDANFGLGESVVGGEAEVDHFVLEKEGSGVVERRVARKSRKVVTVAEGTAWVEVPGDDALTPCLDDDKLKRLGELLRQVEARSGFPQDIEWGFVGEKLYLLQARPITVIPPCWTREESAERFPNAVTPLTWDLVEDGFHRSLNHSFERMGFPPFNGKWFSLFDGYVYGNQNAVRLYMRQNTLPVGDLDALRVVIPVLRQRFAWVQELPIHWFRDLDRYLLGIGALLAEPLEEKNLADVWAFVGRVRALGSDYFLPNIAISITQSSLHRLLHHLLGRVLGEERGRATMDGLLAFCETKTGMINRELYELAALAREETGLVGALAAGGSRDLLEGGLLYSFPCFANEFQTFLGNHGHREVDFDPYHPTWSEAPWLVLDHVRLILRAPPETHPRERERNARLRMRQAENEMLTVFPEDLHFFCMEVVRLLRLYTTLDDLEHYQTTRITLPFRKGLLELGRRLCGRGVFEEPMDVFFARFDDLDQAVRRDEGEEWAQLARRVRVGKEDYLRHKVRTPLWDLQGDVEEPGEPVSDEEILRGLPGSTGRAEGVAFIVAGEEDFAAFPPGAVLVSRTTNPAWTPLFYLAAAVVTESGGPLSHGAVTAREMGIPAVMGVRNLLRSVEKGRRLLVDGSRGTVRWLDGASG